MFWLGTVQVQAMRWYDVMFQHVQLTPLDPRLREQMFWPDTLLLHSVVVPGGLNGVALKLVLNGVECFGTRVVFRGDKPVTAKP